jgi:hypothetical protein
MYGLNGEIQLNIKKKMDYKFLDKVVIQIVRETEIDHERELIRYPYGSPHHLLYHSLLISHLLSLFPFIKHCEDVYGLNEQEIDYVWEEYREIIKDKINNGL